MNEQIAGIHNTWPHDAYEQKKESKNCNRITKPTITLEKNNHAHRATEEEVI